MAESRHRRIEADEKWLEEYALLHRDHRTILEAITLLSGVASRVGSEEIAGVNLSRAAARLKDNIRRMRSDALAWGSEIP